jgi:hypothetical protein
MAGQGLHPSGVNPLVSVGLYMKIVIPTVLYASELWNDMSASDLTAIETFQHFAVKKIQGFNIRTRSDMSESMLGLYRLRSQIEKKKLLFLHKILSLPSGCLTKELFLRKYFMYLLDRTSVKLGFIPDICTIIEKYKLHFILNNFVHNSGMLPPKIVWKNIVNNVIKIKETELWEYRISCDDDFTFFQILQPFIKPAVVYQVCKKSAFRNIMLTIARLWTRTVYLQNSECIFCNMIFQEELVHIISECSKTAQLKINFKNIVLQSFGERVTNDIFQLDHFRFVLKLLGTPLVPLLDNSTNSLLLEHSYRFIVKCVHQYFE